MTSAGTFRFVCMTYSYTQTRTRAHTLTRTYSGAHLNILFSNVQKLGGKIVLPGIAKNSHPGFTCRCTPSEENCFLKVVESSFSSLFPLFVLVNPLTDRRRKRLLVEKTRYMSSVQI